jgi:multiple sugar transport system substrate-binding protein
MPEMTKEKITLKWAALGDGEKGEVEAREAQIAAFEKDYPNINVEFVTIDRDKWSETLTSMAATGSLPDVFWVFNSKEAIMNEWALDVTDFVANDPDTKEIYPKFMEQMTLKGKVHSMPTVMFPNFIFLNKTYFEKYNEPLPSYDWTIEDFKAISERLTHPEEFMFGNNNPWYENFFMPAIDGVSNGGWDGKEYNFNQTWIDGENLKLDYIDRKVTEMATPEEKLKWLGDENAHPPAFGRVAMSWSQSHEVAYYQDTVQEQAGVELLFYPVPQGPAGGQLVNLDAGVISSQTQHPREAWELQKYTSWGEKACIARMEGYKAAGLDTLSRMPVIQNAEVWDMVKTFTTREEVLAAYEILETALLIPENKSITPGWDDFHTWANENDVWGKKDRREVSPEDIAPELTQKANECRDKFLDNLPF